MYQINSSDTSPVKGSSISSKNITYLLFCNIFGKVEWGSRNIGKEERAYWQTTSSKEHLSVMNKLIIDRLIMKTDFMKLALDFLFAHVHLIGQLIQRVAR